MVTTDTPHPNGKVAPGTEHLRDGGPELGFGAVALGRVHAGDAVEAPHRVDAATVSDHTYPAPTVPHGRDHGPLVACRVVVFGRVEALRAVEAAADVDLV